MNLRTKLLCTTLAAFIAAPFGNVAHALTVTFSPFDPDASSIFDGMTANTGGSINPAGAFVRDGIAFSGQGIIANGYSYAQYNPLGANGDFSHNYMAVLGGSEGETIQFSHSIRSLTIDWMTPGTNDKIEFTPEISFTGHDLLAYGATVYPFNIPTNNLLVTFSDFGVTNGINISSPANAFEFSLASASATPEPTTWMMMLLGFAGLGYAARSQKWKLSRLAT